MFGLLNLRKPTGITSRRVVDQVQRLVRPSKVGHAGTLDPLASGVLIIVAGNATRLVEYLHEHAKCYRATFLLGRSSDTEDIEGTVMPELNPRRPSDVELRECALKLTGTIEQRPPVFSALKVEGRRAYDEARKGRKVELAPRSVRVDRLEIVGYAYPELRVEVQCSSGTYIRSLGRDLAQLAGTSGVMSELERTSIGPFEWKDSVDPEQLTKDRLSQYLIASVEAVRGLMPIVAVTKEQVETLSHGVALPLTPDRDEETKTTASALAALVSSRGAGRLQSDRLAAVDEAGRLVAILSRREDGRYSPAKYFPPS